MSISRCILNAWYKKRWYCYLLWPLSLVFHLIVSIRRQRLNARAKISHGHPVIVVGNITVGGTGKTPLVIHLVCLLRKAGYTPGVISRGYGGSSNTYPRDVDQNSYASVVGDEAIVIYGRTQVPMVVDPNRNRAISHLKNHHPEIDIFIADDGLQHYALNRDIEIVVIDAERRLGNRLLMPAGPLREPASRLKEVDFVITNGKSMPGEYSMQLKPKQLININQPVITKPISDFVGERVHAVAGIGNPCRFFNLLTKLGCDLMCHAYPDHYAYRPSDFNFGDSMPVIMTEKDMVKCRDFAEDNWWYLTVDSSCDEAFEQQLLEKLVHLKE